MDELREAWAAYLAADKEWRHAETRAFESEAAYDRMEETGGRRFQAHAALLRAVDKLLEEAPPANLKEVFERYAVDPAMRPTGGGMPLWQCLAHKWRDDMHAFLKLGAIELDLKETRTNLGTHDARPEDQDEL